MQWEILVTSTTGKLGFETTPYLIGHKLYAYSLEHLPITPRNKMVTSEWNNHQMPKIVYIYNDASNIVTSINAAGVNNHTTTIYCTSSELKYNPVMEITSFITQFYSMNARIKNSAKSTCRFPIWTTPVLNYNLWKTDTIRDSHKKRLVQYY